MIMDADVDIDFADRDKILNLIKHVPARQESNVETKQHNSGVYVSDIPCDPLHECAGIDYKEAEKRGYFKIDFLNVSVYNHIKSNEHYSLLMNQEPQWDRLMDKDFATKVVHISNHYGSLIQMKPDSIPRMAMFLALIRPSKRYLIGKSWKEVSDEIWNEPDTGYFFKKSHSLSYALLVVLHMNIISNQHP